MGGGRLPAVNGKRVIQALTRTFGSNPSCTAARDADTIVPDDCHAPKIEVNALTQVIASEDTSRNDLFMIAGGVQLFYLARIMGTSVAQIDATYGHLLPDSEDYLRGLLDDYDEKAETVVNAAR